MKITLKELLDADEALFVLESAKGLPAKIKYRVSKVAQKMVSENEILNPRRIEIFEKIGAVKDPANPTVYKFMNLPETIKRMVSEGILPEDFDHAADLSYDKLIKIEAGKDEAKRKTAFDEEMKDLLTEEVEIKVLPIPLEILDTVPEFTAKHMRFAMWLIETKNEETENE